MLHNTTTTTLQVATLKISLLLFCSPADWHFGLYFALKMPTCLQTVTIYTLSNRKKSLGKVQANRKLIMFALLLKVPSYCFNLCVALFTFPLLLGEYLQTTWGLPCKPGSLLFTKAITRLMVQHYITVTTGVQQTMATRHADFFGSLFLSHYYFLQTPWKLKKAQ